MGEEEGTEDVAASWRHDAPSSVARPGGPEPLQVVDGFDGSLASWRNAPNAAPFAVAPPPAVTLDSQMIPRSNFVVLPPICCNLEEGGPHAGANSLVVPPERRAGDPGAGGFLPPASAAPTSAGVAFRLLEALGTELDTNFHILQAQNRQMKARIEEIVNDLRKAV